MSSLFALGACDSREPEALDGAFADASDAKVAVDAEVDAGEQDAGVMDSGHGGHTDSGRVDSGPHDAGSARDARPSDGNELRDATPNVQPGDESIRGTPFEGLGVGWNEALELCSSWREGRTIEAERAAKARVTLPPATRASLGSGDLEGASLAGATARRGPLASLQWDSQQIGTELVSYELTHEGSGAGMLRAELEHDLGPGGVLVESYAVYRSVGDVRPVTPDATRYELMFSLRSSAIADPDLLVPCGGASRLDNAVHVLVGQRAGETIALTRYARTVDVAAGSAPVELERVEISGPDGLIAAASGFWALTYAAQHHNWSDSSHYDFTWDLAAHELVFEPYARDGSVPLERAIEAIDVLGIDGFDGEPQISVTWRDFRDASTFVDTYLAGRNWMRVDETAIARGLSCPGGQVLTLGDFGTRVFQVSTCPRVAAPGFSVVSLVPVRFPEEASSIGTAVRSVQEVVEGGRPGFRVPVGEHEVTISKGAEAYYFLKVSEGALVVSESLAEPSDLWPAERDETWTFEAPDGEARVRFVRRWVAPGVGESALFAPVVLDAALGPRSWHVEAWDRLEYVNTHHNWMDELRAQAEDATIFWRTELFPIQRDTLRIVDEAGTELLPETEVVRR
ncbi:MAG: hypothetical protein HYV07_11810 [Deltaproteobacteria bacterium]|nr:hypothetical protein [Deltaproteobacteria bacterium]